MVSWFINLGQLGPNSMIIASEKTKLRLAERISHKGVVLSEQFGEMMYSEVMKAEIPTVWGFSFMVNVEVPIAPFGDDSSYSDVLNGQLSRVALIAEQQKIADSLAFENRIALSRKEDAVGEMTEAVESLYRIQVPVGG